MNAIQHIFPVKNVLRVLLVLNHWMNSQVRSCGRGAVTSCSEDTCRLPGTPVCCALLTHSTSELLHCTYRHNTVLSPKWNVISTISCLFSLGIKLHDALLTFEQSTWYVCTWRQFECLFSDATSTVTVGIAQSV
jgi:hypothetical protein